MHHYTTLKYTLCSVLTGAALLLSSCAQASATQTQSLSSSSESIPVTVIDTSTLFSQQDLDGSYDASQAVAILLQGDTAACDDPSVIIDGSTVTITAEGVYILSGTLYDGQIQINAPDSAQVQLVLNGVDITSADSSAIYALEADHVFITLADGSENSLSNGGAYLPIDENNLDSVIFSKTDLTLNGSGSLAIYAEAGHGIVSKDDLIITGGTYTIEAASHGMTGKDTFCIADGTFTITSGKDGLHAENTEDSTLGSLYITGGTFTIAAQGDAVSASGALQIDAGTFDLLTGGGSAAVSMSYDTAPASDRSRSPGSGSDRREAPSGLEEASPDSAAQTNAETTESDSTSPEDSETADSVSQKGLKSDGTLVILDGSFTIDTADDALHAGRDLAIASGEFTLSSGDDAIHSDAAITILDGTYTIPVCYEGIEGCSITIWDGTFSITSYNDGLNAAGDTTGEGADPQIFLTINGGTLTVVSSGDCIDSNGDLTISGGTLDLTCNGAADTALDVDGAYTHTGGSVTTNDGSEENPGSMGGRGGSPGGGRMGDSSSPDRSAQKAPDLQTGS